MEDIPRSIRRAPEDEGCEGLFPSHGRDADGRYVPRLPVKPGAATPLGDSFRGALAALRSLHRRMRYDPVLALEYKGFIEDYLKLDYMRIVKPSDLRTARSICDYIVHHPIWQRGDQGQKLRVSVSKVMIPRLIQTGAAQDVQLHAFSDASRRAMAAVVYVRVSSPSSQPVVSILAAKTKLTSIRSLKPKSTPTPRMTIPRLELRVALIGARLLQTMSAELDIPLDFFFI
ncbi:hypothetical protein TSAR_006779 [Trichomalopsis sarcophagae]|uniref:Uncharacterized protein n=1 Tax=Trichomalopsis sarcophagae TaxID=543379 RepID=A0A232FM08_9HYME|nr:hypothetical protein TSAR_006779 [Trichomalopsis sarcophagae]